MIRNLKTCLVPTQGQVVSQLVFSTVRTKSDGLVAGESKACRAFLFNEVSNRGLQRFMWRMILLTLKNGTAWAGEIGEGKLDSRDARQRIKGEDFSDADTSNILPFIL